MNTVAFPNVGDLFVDWGTSTSGTAAAISNLGSSIEFLTLAG